MSELPELVVSGGPSIPTPCGQFEVLYVFFAPSPHLVIQYLRMPEFPEIQVFVHLIRKGRGLPETFSNH